MIHIEPLKNKQLSLKNSGELSLFFVGVGSAFTKRHNQTNLMIIKGDDHLLIDCGTKCPQALNTVGVSIPTVQNFLITHSHADHIGGLEEAALMGRYIVKKKPTMVINEVYQHLLWDMSLRGGIAFNEENSNDILSFVDFFNVIRPVYLEGYPRETMEAHVGAINVKMFRTKHIPDNSKSWESSFWSCGIIIDDRILYTSDTRFDRDLVLGFEKKCSLEVIFHDCQFFTGGVHSSLEELNQLPELTKKKIHLCHYGDNWEDYKDKIAAYGFAGLTQQMMYYVFE